MSTKHVRFPFDRFISRRRSSATRVETRRSETGISPSCAVGSLVVVAVWAAVGLWIAPRFLEHPPADTRWTDAAQGVTWLLGETPEHRLQAWRLLHRASLLVMAAIPLIVAVPRAFGPAFFERFVGEADPRTLGCIRCWVFLILIAHVVSEDLAGIALLPAVLRRPMGLMSLCHAVPGWDLIYSSATALVALKVVTIAAMGAAMAGWKTRWSVPCAALLGLLCGGIVREYSYFFHQSIVPLQLAIVLSFLPCGDGFSVDQFQRQRTCGQSALGKTAEYGWSRYACWVLIAGAYLSAGLSKLRHGGWTWWNGLNLKNIILTDTMEPKPYDWGLERFLAELPLEVFAVLGLVGLLTEVSYGAVLVSRPARLVMPLLAAGLHLGILISSGSCFWTSFFSRRSFRSISG